MLTPYDNDPHGYAAYRIACSFKTRHVTDLQAQAMLIRSARSPEEKQMLQRIVLDARAEWLAYLTVTQRQWQAKTTRRPSRARHHDSIEIREKYVRVAG